MILRDGRLGGGTLSPLRKAVGQATESDVFAVHTRLPFKKTLFWHLPLMLYIIQNVIEECDFYISSCIFLLF